MEPFFIYFEWFGLWECEVDQERIDTYYRKNHYFAKSIKLTDFGSKIMPILLYDRNIQIWNISERRSRGEINPIPGAELEDMMFGVLPDEVVNAIFERMEEDKVHSRFSCTLRVFIPMKPYKRLYREYKREFIEGIYIFNVSLQSGIWRKLVLSGRHTMEDLHDIFLNPMVLMMIICILFYGWKKMVK